MGKIAVRAGIAIVLLVAGGVITLVGERLLGGRIASNEMRISTFQDWRVICPPLTQTTPNCALTSDVMRDTGGILLTLSLLDPAPGKELSLTVPHGVLLDSGLGFAIGNEPLRVRPYETCTNQGCIALVTLDADTLKSLTTNMGGHIAVAAPNNPQPVNIPFSLKGFADGYGELQRAKARRSGIFAFLNRS
ncbi:MAG TPA: invasion associated locus B family protein [Micropepsaceae bacterium]|nr:invasion associated locus B family protein [Micropepsaceae bacterium]